MISKSIFKTYYKRLSRLPITTLNFLGYAALFTCCTQQKEPLSKKWQTFQARCTDPTPIYRAQVPSDWRRKNPDQLDFVYDSKLPLCEFFIEEDNPIRITLHTFPFSHFNQQISPFAQVNRWKSQFSNKTEPFVLIDKTSQNGFSGLFIEAYKENEGLLAWSMILDPYIYYCVQGTDHCADFTIKVVGDAKKIQKHRQEIVDFAESFEFIASIEKE